jgi:tetratricopeptide (TPR) repeat protein
MTLYPVSAIAPSLPYMDAVVMQDVHRLRTLLKQYPAHVDMWHAIGHALREQEQVDDAIEAYNHAIMMAARYHAPIHFEHSAMLLRRACLRFMQAETEAAQADIAAALFQDHTNPAALFLQQHGWHTDTPPPPYSRFALTHRAREALVQGVLPEQVKLTPEQHAMDAAIELWQAGQGATAAHAMRSLTQRCLQDPLPWHRLALMTEGEEAAHAIQHALTLQAAYHRQYHRGAALHFLHRGQLYDVQGEETLAMMDYIRACDMDTSFEDARHARNTKRSGASNAFTS